MQLLNEFRSALGGIENERSGSGIPERGVCEREKNSGPLLGLLNSRWPRYQISNTASVAEAIRGDGGAVVTIRDDLAEQVRVLRNYGQKVKHEHFYKGFNSRLDIIQAAILRVKLRHLDSWNEARRRAASTYDKLFAGNSVATPQVADYARHVFHLYVVRTTQRKKLQAALDAENISHGIHYPTPVHLQPAFVELNYPKGSFPVCESIAAEILSLPMFPEITEEQIRRVVSACLGRD